jgi:hypothetical protein
MGVRAYVLLDVAKGKSQDVARALRGKSGVVMVDIVEGPPDVVAVLEASERLILADLVTQASEAVESLINRVYLLPVRGEVAAPRLSEPVGRRRK